MRLTRGNEVLRIHIVQKGDTLWKIAQKYNVDFEELKRLNSHLSDPNMLMPGMKIKIPSGYLSVKPKKEMPIKEAPVKEKPQKEIMPTPPLMPSKESPQFMQPMPEPHIPAPPPMPPSPPQMPIMPQMHQKQPCGCPPPPPMPCPPVHWHHPHHHHGPMMHHHSHMMQPMPGWFDDNESSSFYSPPPMQQPWTQQSWMQQPQPAMPQPTHWPGHPQYMHTDPMWHMPQYIDPMMTPYYGSYPGYQMPMTQAPMFSDVSGSGDSAYRDENQSEQSEDREEQD